MEDELPARSDGTLVFGGIALLGIALWVQLLGAALLAEFRSPASSFFHVIAYAAPLGIVLAGVMFRSPILLLMVFLSSFIPGIVLLPETFDVVEGSGSVRIGLSCLVYILAVSYSFLMRYAPRTAAKNEVEDSKTTEHLQSRIELRLFYIFTLLVVLQYAVHGDPLVGQTIAQNFEDPAVAMISISVALFFVWAISVYMYFIVPALNFEHDYSKWKSLKQKGDENAFSHRKIIERNAFPFVFILLMLSLVAFFI